MKKSPTASEIDMQPTAVPLYDRREVVKIFQEFGFAEDLKNRYITVLREIDFPFRRITIPNTATVSQSLLDRYLMDMAIHRDPFYAKLTALA